MGYSNGAQWGFNSTATLIHAGLGVNFLTVPSAAKWGVDMLQATFSAGYLRSTGFSVDGSGSVQIGTSILSANSTGALFDAPGAIATATALNAGGSGWVLNDVFFFGPNESGIGYASGVTAGAVTAITILRQPVSATDAPSAVGVTTRKWAPGLGTGLTVNITWSVRDGVTIASAARKLAFYGATPVAKPTGVAVSAAGVHAALVTLGLIAA
jgi:hypothetical protein